MSLFTDKNVTPVVVYDESGNPIGSGGSALPNGTDRSGTINSTNTAQQLAPANPARKSLTGQAPSNAAIGINEVGGAASIGQPGTYVVAAGQAFSIATNRAISIVCGTVNAVWSATET